MNSPEKNRNDYQPAGLISGQREESVYLETVLGEPRTERSNTSYRVRTERENEIEGRRGLCDPAQWGGEGASSQKTSN